MNSACRRWVPTCMENRLGREIPTPVVFRVGEMPHPSGTAIGADTPWGCCIIISVATMVVSSYRYSCLEENSQFRIPTLPEHFTSGMDLNASQ